MWQGWEHVVGCGGMWQGVGTCGMGGGRVWGHVTGVWIHNRGSGLGAPQALVECSSYVQTGRANWSCKLVVQTGRANCSCKLLMQTAHANCSCKLLMQTAHANCSCSSPRVLVESCMSAHGELHVHSWSSSSGCFILGLGTWGVGPRVGGMWQGVGACGRVWGHVVGGQA